MADLGFEHVFPDLTNKQILVSNGRNDPIVSIDETERLVSLFQKAGAAAALEWQAAGHQLTRADLHAAERWLRSLA